MTAERFGDEEGEDGCAGQPDAACGDGSGAEGADADDGADEEGTAGGAEVGDEAPCAEELSAADGGGEVGAEGHVDAAAEAVPEGDQEAGEQEGEVGFAEGDEEHAGAHEEEAGDAGELPAPAVHDDADRVEEGHIKGGGEAEDDGDLGGIEADAVAPEGDDGLAAGAEDLDGKGSEPGCGEDGGVFAENAKYGVAAGGGAVVGGCFADDGEDRDGGGEGEQGLEVEGGIGADERRAGSADEGAGEVADAVGAADEGEDATTLVKRGDVGGVGEAGEHPDGPGAAHEEGERCEEERGRGEGEADGDEEEDGGGGEHGPAFAEAGDHDAGGDIEGHGADAAECDEEAGVGGGGPDFDGVEGHDGDDRALPDRKEEGGEVDRDGKGADAEGRRADVSVHVSIVGAVLFAGEPTARRSGRAYPANMGQATLLDVLADGRAGERLRAFDAAGGLTALIPELEAGRGFAQPELHAYDVLGHSLAAVEAVDAVFGDGVPGREFREAIGWVDFDRWLEREVGGVPLPALVRLGALLHDVAKPATATFEDGRLRFPRHGPAGADMMAPRLAALGLEAEAAALVGRLIRYHLRPAELVRNWPATDRAVRRFVRDLDGEVLALMVVNLADGWATQGPRYTREHFRRHCGFVNYVLARAWGATEGDGPEPLVTGDDLIAELGLSGGRLLGAVLTSVRHAQLEGQIRTRDEALALARDVLTRPGFAE